MRIAHLLVLAALTDAAAAQAPPRAIDAAITSSTSPLDGEQAARVEAWAGYWTRQMAAKDATPERIEEARRELLAPLSPLNRPSDVFRDAYARVVVRPLRDVLDADDANHALANAVITLSQLGSEQSLNLLVDHTDRSDETRDPVRLLAAKGVYVTILQARGGVNNAINPRSLGAAVRLIRDAAQNEENPLVLRYQLQAILAANDEDARKHYVTALRSVADRIAGQSAGPSPLMQPVYLSQADLRDQYLRLQAAEKRALGQDLGPALGKLLQIVLRHWNVQDLPESKEFYGSVVRAAEVFFRVVDGEVRGPAQMVRTDLHRHWEAADRQAFEQDLARLLEVLGRPPYKN